MAQTKPTPFRFSPELDALVESLAKKLGKSKQETMRLCMEIGAKWIEANGYDSTVEIKAAPIIATLQGLLEVASERLVEVLEKQTASSKKK